MIKPFHRIKRQTLLRHLIAWLLILVYYIFYSSIRGPFIAKFAWIALLLVNYISSFYILVIFIWPKVLVQKSILFLGLLIVLVVFFCTFFYFQVNIVTPWLGGDHPISRMNIYESTNNSLRIFLYIFFTSIGTYNNWSGIAKVKDDIEIEKKKINTEFLFLKNQFHSHLTFNFLNFCYYKIQGISSITADSVEDFANMLRYSLKSKSDHLVLLDEEINYVKNYILFKKRIEGLKIQFIYEIHQSSSLIHPKSFATFIEFWFNNIFLCNSQECVLINIKRLRKKTLLTIDTKCNSISYDFSNKLKTIDQVLELFYDDSYLLQVRHAKENISFQLSLIDIKTPIKES